MKEEAKLIAFDKEKALNFLMENRKNRKLNDGLVRKYALAMLSGRWNENDFNPVARTADKIILNGQHRLWAIVYAETVTIKLWVRENVDPGIIGIVDSGKSRSLVDRLALSDSIPNYIDNQCASRMFAGAIRYFFVFPSTDTTKASWETDTISQAANMIFPHMRFAFQSLIDETGKLPAFLRLAGVLTAVARAHACKVPEETLIAFCDVLKSGLDSGLKKAKPNKYVRAVRDWILQKQFRKYGGAGKADAQAVYFLVARAIYIFDNDLVQSRVVIKNEDLFPRAKRITEYLQSITPEKSKWAPINKLNARLVYDGVFDGRAHD